MIYKISGLCLPSLTLQTFKKTSLKLTENYIEGERLSFEATFALGIVQLEVEKKIMPIGGHTRTRFKHRSFSSRAF